MVDIERYRGIRVYDVNDQEIIEILSSNTPKFIFFVEDPKVLSKYFVKIESTIQKITSGYYSVNIEKENIYIIKTKKVIIEEVLMEELDKIPVAVFCPSSGEYDLITF